jgi:beta-glucosidase
VAKQLDYGAVMPRLDFPSGFLWGAATSAYQIEGGAREGGRGESIWDRFSRTPGRIHDGTTGDVACDHFHRWKNDVALMAELGLRAYRFSIAWPRVLPEGTGPVNSIGLDFYSRLVDALLAAGITPLVTLYHWDLPQALEDRGGFRERSIAGWFSEYASVVGRALGDRVELWTTLNEPQVFGVFGHITGEQAPGLVDFHGYAATAHHLNLAHGAAVQALRASMPRARVGTVMQMPAVYPLTRSEADLAAAQRFDLIFNRFYLDPVLLGHYPDEALEILAPLSPPIRDGDLAVIHQPLDFIGVNNYTRAIIRHAPEYPLFEFISADDRVAGARYTAMGWEIFPEGLYEVLTRLRTDYGNPPVHVTEAGCAMHDHLENAHVHDPERIEYLRAYIASVHRALSEGADVRGFFVWSLFDNFEWQHGYKKRFGIVYVDYDSLARIPKSSARWYRSVIAENALDFP